MNLSSNNCGINFVEYMEKEVDIEPFVGMRRKGEKEKRRNGETHMVVQRQPNRSAICRCTLRGFGKVMPKGKNEYSVIGT